MEEVTGRPSWKGEAAAREGQEEHSSRGNGWAKA